jgi:hypothetical protein
MSNVLADQINRGPVPVSEDSVVGERPEDELARYHALADLIRWENPYGYQATLPADLESAHEAVGLTESCDASQPFRRTMRDLAPAERQQLLHWQFGQDQVVISKAMRVPYSYLRTRDGVQERVTSSILIGYNGPSVP